MAAVPAPASIAPLEEGNLLDEHELADRLLAEAEERGAVELSGGCYDLTSNQSFVPKTDTYQGAIGGTWTGDNVKFTSEVDYTWSHFTQEGIILDTQYNPPPDGRPLFFRRHSNLQPPGLAGPLHCGPECCSGQRCR